MNSQLRLSSRELAKKYLGKGIRKPRFRETQKWTIQNRIIMALLYAEDLKISQFAQRIGVHHRSAASWVYEGAIPKKHRWDLISEVLKFPAEYIFDPSLIGITIELPEPSRFLERVWGKKIANRLLAGLLKVHQASPTDVARWCGISAGTLRKYIHEGMIIGNKEYQDRLADFFRIPPHILFYEGVGMRNIRKSESK